MQSICGTMNSAPRLPGFQTHGPVASLANAGTKSPTPHPRSPLVRESHQSGAGRTRETAEKRSRWPVPDTRLTWLIYARGIQHAVPYPMRDAKLRRADRGQCGSPTTRCVSARRTGPQTFNPSPPPCLPTRPPTPTFRVVASRRAFFELSPENERTVRDRAAGWQI